MNVCDSMASLILAKLDGTLDGEQADRLASHLRGCPACQQALADQARVKQALAQFSFAPVSPDFAAFVRQRLAHPGWLDLANWRVCTLRLAPLAALVLAAVAWLPAARPSSQALSLARVLASWAADGASDTQRELLLNPSVTGEALLAAALEEQSR